MKKHLYKWRSAGLLPALSITGLVILGRLAGVLQPLEWNALDRGLRSRPAETVDTRVTIVSITEADIQTTVGYPISDRDLALLIERLDSYNPRVIGIDIFRDQPIGERGEVLQSVLAAADNNIVGIQSIEFPIVLPPTGLEEAQIGFADNVIDDDGKSRRSLLASADEAGNYKFSFPLQLAQAYLAEDNITLENGIQDPETIRFGNTEIPRFQPNTGGYIRTDNGGNQALLNFRSGSTPFIQVSYSDVMSGKVTPGLLQNRAVLIGYTAESVKDYVYSQTVAERTSSGMVPGVVIQAHALSQILSAVYDNRPFLKTLPDILEYVLILGSGLTGAMIAQSKSKPSSHLIKTITLSAMLIISSYMMLLLSWWLPIAPVLLAFLATNILLHPFYQEQKRLIGQITEKQDTIDWIYNSIHNGPLQTLSTILLSIPKDQPNLKRLRANLHQLNKELRGLRQVLDSELISPSLLAVGEKEIDLDLPLHELLYETYQATIERYRNFFASVTKIVQFSPMADSKINFAQKKELVRFLEEALLNIYKHSENATRIKIVCGIENQNNIIKVIDNGTTRAIANRQIARNGDGTKQAAKLARKLRGKFQRSSTSSKSTLCELQWPIKGSTF